MFPIVLAAVGLLVFAANSMSIYYDFKVVRTSLYHLLPGLYIVAEFKSNLDTNNNLCHIQRKSMFR